MVIFLAEESTKFSLCAGGCGRTVPLNPKGWTVSPDGTSFVPSVDDRPQYCCTICSVSHLGEINPPEHTDLCNIRERALMVQAAEYLAKLRDHNRESA